MASIIRLNSSPLQPSPIVCSNPAGETDRTNGVVRVSLDNAKTRGIYKMVYSGSFGYSHLTDLGNNQVGLLFERDDYSKISFMVTGL